MKSQVAVRCVALGFVSLLSGQVSADCYMMNPRGSNNRLKEQSANRANANRLCDTQNNNRGGYNVGDSSKDGQQNGADKGDDLYDVMYNPNYAEQRKQYNMMYLENSILRMTWTNQHGCGNAKNNCNQVLEWGCDTHDYLDDGNERQNLNEFNNIATGTRMTLRNGDNTN